LIEKHGRERAVPAISMFFGVVIYMYFFDDEMHKTPRGAALGIKARKRRCLLPTRAYWPARCQARNFAWFRLGSKFTATSWWPTGNWQSTGSHRSRSIRCDSRGVLKMDIPELVRVTPISPSDLLLGYSDGFLRKFACAPYLDRGVFSRLKDSTLFGQAHVAHGTVCWPGGLDIAPETLFVRSVVVTAREAIAD
jgi:Protein of unknown function (DUF2442)